MGSKTDKIKGRLKEALGALTDNDNLKRAGQRDQAVGAAKRVAEKITANVQQVAEKLTEQGQRVAKEITKA